MERRHIDNLDLESFERGKLHRVWYDIITDPFGQPISLPVLIGRGKEDGPVVGLTAVVHGNELNGISVIQKLMNDLADIDLRGTVLGIPVVNIPSFMRKQRRFVDGYDLNHIMPGIENGSVSQVYAHRFFNGLISHMDYLLDLHTASGGRVNSYYVRANMNDEVTRELAILQNAQIILHNPASDGTLRGAAVDKGITAITLEVGDPSVFQKGMIRSGLTGLMNALVYLDMIDDEIDQPEMPAIVCNRSYWIFTSEGGILTVYPKLATRIKKGDLIATQLDIFGEVVKQYHAPEDGIVIGKSVNPVSQSGARILHLGVER